jgi:hypothetical protein
VINHELPVEIIEGHQIFSDIVNDASPSISPVMGIGAPEPASCCSYINVSLPVMAAV